MVESIRKYILDQSSNEVYNMILAGDILCLCGLVDSAPTMKYSMDRYLNQYVHYLNIEAFAVLVAVCSDKAIDMCHKVLKLCTAPDISTQEINEKIGILLLSLGHSDYTKNVRS